MNRITRRRFVKATSLVGAGTILHGCTLPVFRSVHDVAVIGAGMAGMTAARELIRAGLDVVVLEARERVGGRMETLEGPAPHGLEVGAQMIHGSRAPTWALIREFGMETRSLMDWTPWQWTPGGGFRQPSPEHLAAVQRRLDEAYHAYRGEDTSYQKLLDTLSLEEEDLAIVNEKAIGWSAEPDEISLQAAMEDSAAWDGYFDQNFQVIGGYSALARKMAGTLGDRVRLSSPVMSVEWRRGRALVNYEHQGTRESVEARRAVLTHPIGVLQARRPAFHPDLPAWKQRAIDALHMGRVVVIHLLFDDWFWRAPAGSGAVRWSEQGGRVLFWDPHPRGKGMPVLRVWVQGRVAQELSDLGEKASMDRVLGWMAREFPGSNAKGRLRWSVFRDWVRDPYSLGSYSYTRPGGASQRAVLAIPIDDTLHFAGEATQAPPHYQTVHGAYMSGLRAAREILGSLGVDSGA